MNAKKALWIRLKGYRFQNLVPVSLTDRILGAFGETDPFTRAFAAKVAKKHGWTAEFAFLAVREYKKFVYLGVTSHYQVTPSTVIDQVWHEHLHFTRGYREFCMDILGRHFDHNPELIPFDDQTTVFDAQYNKTLAFYQHEFGVEPPPEIWGRPKFDPKLVAKHVEKPARKADTASSCGADPPLFTQFTSEDASYAPIPVVFSGGGGSGGGGGASGGWEASPKSGANVSVDIGNAPVAASEAASSTSSGCSSSCGGGD